MQTKNLSQNTKEYIQNLFRRRPLDTILNSVSQATEKGYFNYPMKARHMDRAVTMNFLEFVQEFKIIWDEHIIFSDSLLELVPSLSAMPVIKRKGCLLPLYQTAIENDAKTMGFSIFLNEREKPGRFSEGRSLLTNLLEKAGVQINDGLMNIFFSPYASPSFGVEFTHTISHSLYTTSKDFLMALINPSLTLKKIEEYEDHYKLIELAVWYTYGDISQLIPKLRPLVEMDLQKVYLSIKNAHNMVKLRYEELINKIHTALCATEDKELFDNLLDAIQWLLYTDNYLEELERFNLGCSMGDYLLRDLTANTLKELDALEMNDPMMTNQMDILYKLKEVVGG